MRYYLHQIRPGEIVRDPEGADYADLASAELEAVDAAREMMATAVRVGRDISDWSIEIVDETDTPLRCIPFASVVRREGRPSRRSEGRRIPDSDGSAVLGLAAGR